MVAGTGTCGRAHGGRRSIARHMVQRRSGSVGDGTGMAIKIAASTLRPLDAWAAGARQRVQRHTKNQVKDGGGTRCQGGWGQPLKLDGGGHGMVPRQIHCFMTSQAVVGGAGVCLGSHRQMMGGLAAGDSMGLKRGERGAGAGC